MDDSASKNGILKGEIDFLRLAPPMTTSQRYNWVDPWSSHLPGHQICPRLRHLNQPFCCSTNNPGEDPWSYWSVSVFISQGNKLWPTRTNERWVILANVLSYRLYSSYRFDWKQAPDTQAHVWSGKEPILLWVHLHASPSITSKSWARGPLFATASRELTLSPTHALQSFLDTRIRIPRSADKTLHILSMETAQNFNRRPRLMETSDVLDAVFLPHSSVGTSYCSSPILLAPYPSKLQLPRLNLVSKWCKSINRWLAGIDIPSGNFRCTQLSIIQLRTKLPSALAIIPYLGIRFLRLKTDEDHQNRE